MVSNVMPAAYGNEVATLVPSNVLESQAQKGATDYNAGIDGGSNVIVPGATANLPVTGDGIHPVTFFATDNQGNSPSQASLDVKIDTVQSILTSDLNPPPSGFFNEPVTGTYICLDPAPGWAIFAIQMP